MTQHRVLIDIQFTVDADQFKVAQLSGDATGVSEATEAGIRDAVTRRLVRIDWAEQGLLPTRSLVTTRVLTSSGHCARVSLPADRNVTNT